MMQPERSFQGFGSRFRQNSFPYDVKRDVYNEENFQQEHRRKTASSGNVDIDITTFSHHVQCRCSLPLSHSCSWHKFRRCMLTVFPFLEWMCFYRFKDWLLGDLLAGISVGLVQLPQGSFFLVSALMINVLRIYPFNSGRLVLGTFIRDDFSNLSFFEGYNKSLSVVASTTLLTGIIQLSMGMLGFGFIVTYLPEAVISAYLAATALHIMLSQLTCIFGIMISFNSGPVSFVYNIINYCIGLPKANSTSILLFLTAVVALRINRCIRISVNQYPIEFPMEVFLILGFTAFASKINMATENSKMLIDMIPYSFLFPETPDLSMLTAVILESFSLAVVSSSLLVFLGRKIAIFHNYDVNSNQDLIAIGLCNVVSSFFRSYVFTGAVIRTVIQDKSGGRQQFASLVGAGVMLLLMVKVGRFFYELPNAVLAGIVLSNALPYLETVYNLPNLWRQNQYDCVSVDALAEIAWMVTFISAIFLGLDVGLLVSVAFTFFIITVQSHRTKILLLGQIPNTNIYRSIHDYREVRIHITPTPLPKRWGYKHSWGEDLPVLQFHHICKRLLPKAQVVKDPSYTFQIEMVRVPLTEEEVYALFSQSEDGSQQQKICRCFCNCDELEPRPRVVYTERFESKRDKYSSSINLIRCSRFESMNTNQSMSDEQVPYTTSSISQENPIPNYEDVEKVWPSDNSSRLFSTLPEASESQVRDRPPMPYLASSLQPLIHTIILDFSMVHLVDSQASVVLRQMCNAFQNANILVLIAGCHCEYPSPYEENGESRHKMSSSFIEIPKNKSPGFSTLQDPVREEESELDLELDRILESEQEPGLDLDLDLDHEMEPESELEPESEMDPETEPEPELESRPRAQTYPQQQYWPLYQSLAPNSAPQT
ncbi:Testis anion transporter 1 [Camelus dromedarius]|uniref:Testis anion transporter 1 n=1 Tax=Camelus dromedarius TaxID=9838 RepID=A0A5N4CRJ4_CAMDR|nr:Testis anion transporter 1 [Camelus dromedarius]